MPEKYPLFRNPYAGVLLAALAGLVGGIVFGHGLFQTRPFSDLSFTVMSGVFGASSYALLFAGALSSLTRYLARPARELLPRAALCFTAGLLPLILYFPYLLHRSGIEGDTVELPPLDSRYAVVLLLAWSALLTASLLKLSFSNKQNRVLEIIKNRPALVLAIMMIIWLAVFFTMDSLKNHYMQTNTLNSAVYSESLVNIFDDRGFMYSNIAFGEGASIFAAHSNFIMLFLVPIFNLWPDYRLLLFLSDLALVLSAIPLYLLARRRFPVDLSLLLTAMFLFHPIMTAQPGRSDFSELRFMPILFLTAFYFFETNRFWKFAMAALLLMSIREDFGLFVFIIGIYALIKHRPLKWVITPLAFGVTWFVTMVFFVIPYFNAAGEALRISTRYSGLGESASEVLLNLLTKPWIALEVAISTPSHIGVLYGLFLSFGMGIPMLSSAVLLAVPAIAELLFQQSTTLVNFMALLSLPTLMVAVIFGLSRLDRIGQRFGNYPNRTAAVAGIFIFFMALTPFHAWFNPGMYQPRYNYEAARQAFDLVPDDARVELPEFMLAFGKKNQTVSGFHQATYQLEQGKDLRVTADYIIIDRHIPARTGDNLYYNGLIETTRYIENSPDYRKVYSADDIELFVRRGFQPAGEEV